MKHPSSVKPEPAGPFSRRELLQRGAIAAAGAWLATAGSASAAAADDLSSGCIDAHSHIWSPDVRRIPLAAGFSRTEMRPPSFTPGELLEQAHPCGVGRVVLIQMSYYGFDNRYMVSSMHQYAGTFSGVAVVDHHAPQLQQTMRQLKDAGVRGFRIHPGREQAAPWLADEAMAAFWRFGAQENLAMCALVNPEALAPLDKMCERHADTTLVIDHFARIGMDGTIRDADVDNLCRLSRHEKVYVKTSAFYALGKKKAPYLDLGPMIHRLVDAYGPERLMWGSDCPYQVEHGNTYGDSIDLIRSRLDFLSQGDREWMLRKTAERVFFS